MPQISACLYILKSLALHHNVIAPSTYSRIFYHRKVLPISHKRNHRLNYVANIILRIHLPHYVRQALLHITRLVFLTVTEFRGLAMRVKPGILLHERGVITP